MLSVAVPTSNANTSHDVTKLPVDDVYNFLSAHNSKWKNIMRVILGPQTNTSVPSYPTEPTAPHAVDLPWRTQPPLSYLAQQRLRFDL